MIRLRSILIFFYLLSLFFLIWILKDTLFVGGISWTINGSNNLGSAIGIALSNSIYEGIINLLRISSAFGIALQLPYLIVLFTRKDWFFSHKYNTWLSWLVLFFPYILAIAFWITPLGYLI